MRFSISGPEMPDQALHGPCRGIAERADRVAFELGRDFEQQRRSRASGRGPSTMRFITRHIQPVPSRHGVHWPQLSCL